MWSAVDKTQSNLSHISILFVWSILFKSIQDQRMCLKSYVNVQKKKKFPFKLTIHWNTEQLKHNLWIYFNLNKLAYNYKSSTKEEWLKPLKP